MVIEIPCKSYTSQFYHKFLGSPAEIYRDKTLCILIKMALDGKRLLDSNKEKTHKYESMLFINIRKSFHNQFGACFTNKKITTLNIVLENYMKSIMRHKIATYMDCGFKPTDAIRESIFSSGLNEDVFSLESVKKDFQRNNKNVYIEY